MQLSDLSIATRADTAVAGVSYGVGFLAAALWVPPEVLEPGAVGGAAAIVAVGCKQGVQAIFDRLRSDEDEDELVEDADKTNPEGEESASSSTASGA